MKHTIRPLLLLLSLSAVSVTAVGDERYQSHDSIVAAAENLIREIHPWQDADATVSGRTLDSRTRLSACASPLEAFLPSGATVRRRTTVGVRCHDAKPWKIYLPVTVKVHAWTLVAARPLPAGTILSAEDVVRKKRDISALSYGYLASLEQQGGYRTKRLIGQGAVISPSMVESAVMIRRGQRVRLVHKSGGVQVSMAGEALASASLGSQIVVKNTNSGKKLSGIVKASDTVEVSY